MDIFADIIKEFNYIQYPLIKLVLSMALGALIGAEREYKSNVAGFRTIFLITLGSTLFTLVSVALVGQGDPTRIASTVVTGSVLSI